jgi:hypothetical protein
VPRERIRNAETPAARLAAVVEHVIETMRFERKSPHFDPTPEDFEKALKPFLLRELLNARVQELLLPAMSLNARAEQLRLELVAVDKLLEISTRPLPGQEDYRNEAKA